MTSCRWLTLVLLVTSSLAFAPAPLPRADRRPKPVMGMEGTWQGQSRLLITPTRLTYHPHETPIEYVLSVDARATPATYRLRSAAGRDEGWAYHGIWRIQGDTLTLCYSP